MCQIHFIFQDDHLQLSLLLFQFLDPCFIRGLLILVLRSELGYLLHHCSNFRIQLIALLVGVVGPLFLFLGQKPFFLAYALIQDLDEGLEDVVEEECSDERPVISVSFHEALFLVLQIPGEILFGKQVELIRFSIFFLLFLLLLRNDVAIIFIFTKE